MTDPSSRCEGCGLRDWVTCETSQTDGVGGCTHLFLGHVLSGYAINDRSGFGCLSFAFAFPLSLPLALVLPLWLKNTAKQTK